MSSSNFEIKVFVQTDTNQFYLGGRSFDANFYDWAGFNIYQNFRLIRRDEDLTSEPQSWAEMAVPFFNKKRSVKALKDSHPSVFMAKQAKRLIKSETNSDSPNRIVFGVYLNGEHLDEGKMDFSMKWQSWFWDRLLTEEFESLFDEFINYFENQAKNYTLNQMAKASIIIHHMTDGNESNYHVARYGRLMSIKDQGFKMRMLNKAWSGDYSSNDNELLYKFIKSGERGLGLVYSEQ